MIRYRAHDIKIGSSMGMPVAVVLNPKGGKVVTYPAATEHEAFLRAKEHIDTRANRDDSCTTEQLNEALYERASIHK